MTTRLVFRRWNLMANYNTHVEHPMLRQVTTLCVITVCQRMTPFMNHCKHFRSFIIYDAIAILTYDANKDISHCNVFYNFILYKSIKYISRCLYELYIFYNNHISHTIFFWHHQRVRVVLCCRTSAFNLWISYSASLKNFWFFRTKLFSLMRWNVCK